ncbi:MAG: NifB/NifX family molybdenum-iron cluster-binding protein [Spirochaetales bacterium]|nr:NifB/NifX family molybdenum-iron cluster-binding protein [Spirochaetales bacterium]
MKIAVSASGTDQSAQVDPRFGRCQYFLIIDSESNETEAVPNAAQTAGGGAGVQAAQTVADHGAQTVLTGNVGPNAHRALEAANISVITGVSGAVSDALKAFREGKYKAVDGPTVQSHFGMSGPGKE